MFLSYTVGAGEEKAVADFVTDALEAHLDSALERFFQDGFTENQLLALDKNPGLKGAYTGDRIDEFFKEAVSLDPELAHLKVTPRFTFGPDVYDPEAARWWDVTTVGDWAAHVEKYTGPQFGAGTPLLYGPGY